MAKNSEVTWVPASFVRRRYGGEQPISDMTLHRWQNSPTMNFPKPTYFGRNRFWRLDELEAFDRTRPSGRTLAAAQSEAAA